MTTAWSRDPDWWRGAVIYQIYPRSFQDDSGDGIGDLAGITRRLPHVAELGADAVWISPFFTSPMADFGYDVSDYRDVDPMFGTLADFDALIARAHDLGLKVMIDLVLSHSSDQHPWFRESQASRSGEKADWYVWADAHPDGSPPNNWLAIFGGSAWEWHGGRMQYYLHNFLKSQPDLNFHNPDVQDALLDVTRFWLDRGVDGFRLDTINFYFHDKRLRSNPALPVSMRNDLTAPAVNPYNWQNHLYSKSQPENLAFLQRFRALCNEYNAAAVGEVGDSQRGLEIMAEYTSGGDKVQMCYPFELLQPHRLGASGIEEVFRRLAQVSPDFWPCWALSNHDVVRHVTRWDLSPEAARLYITLMASLRGSICLYQGEELGLPEADLMFEDLQDPYGKQFWPEFKGRDGCRTPMAWEQASLNAGFSTGKPWLPVAASHLPLAVDAQVNDPESLLSHYRRVLAMRRRNPALQTGAQEDLRAESDVLTLRRIGKAEELFCAFNLSDHPAEVALPPGTWTSIAAEIGGADASTAFVTLQPWQCYLASRSAADRGE